MTAAIDQFDIPSILELACIQDEAAVEAEKQAPKVLALFAEAVLQCTGIDLYDCPETEITKCYDWKQGDGYCTTNSVSLCGHTGGNYYPTYFKIGAWTEITSVTANGSPLPYKEMKAMFSNNVITGIREDCCQHWCIQCKDVCITGKKGLVIDDRLNLILCSILADFFIGYLSDNRQDGKVVIAQETENRDIKWDYVSSNKSSNISSMTYNKDICDLLCRYNVN